MDEKDTAFAGLQGVQDNLARQRCEEGIATSVKHTGTEQVRGGEALEKWCA